MNTIKVIVTGGSGLVGQALKQIVDLNRQGELQFTFLSSADGDLRNFDKVDILFSKYKPDIVIHCASVVAGLYGNMTNNYEMLVDNLKINTNVLECCKKYNVKRLINILSTCVFGNNLTYPLTSEQMYDKIPDVSNEGYSYSKRILNIGSKLLTKCSDIEIVNLIPCNLFGLNDNFNLQNGHVLPMLIHKIHLAKQNDVPLTSTALAGKVPLIINGTGSALRQFIYAEDFGKIILHFVNTKLSNKFNSLIVGPPVKDEISIKEIVLKLTNFMEFNGKIVYDTNYSDGQHKKTVSNDELLTYIPDFKFTSLDVALKKTIVHFIQNFDTVRK